MAALMQLLLNRLGLVVDRARNCRPRTTCVS